MNAIAAPIAVPARGATIWFALAFGLMAMILPDCCLNGLHASGMGMDAFGMICRSAR